MRQGEKKILSKPYAMQHIGDPHRRLDSAIDAYVPSAEKLAGEILHDLDLTNHGVKWWGYLAVHERILIGDYLYQCVNAIQVNLTEAKLHYFEWLDTRDKENDRIANAVSLDDVGEARLKHPSSHSGLDDLPERLQRLHLGGFFRAIGSSLDCLGGAIIGVLGLKISLRRGDLNEAEKTLRLTRPTDAGSKLQKSFLDSFANAKERSGPEDWLKWTNQYRNMFVHRGRRASSYEVIPREHLFYDPNGQIIPRATSKLHLARFPDRSEVEALIVGKHTWLGEDAADTLSLIFESCRALQEETCERLCSIWDERRRNPTLIQQPIEQWKTKIRSCRFAGYDPSKPFLGDTMNLSGSLAHRIRAAAVDDAQRSLWDGSDWGN